MVFNYKKNRAWAENLTVVMQIGLTMAGCIVFCFFVGLYIDKWVGTKGIFVTIREWSRLSKPRKVTGPGQSGSL
jgi:hypothetical protein